MTNLISSSTTSFNAIKKRNNPMTASPNLNSHLRIPEATITMSSTQPHSPLRNVAPSKAKKVLSRLVGLASCYWKKCKSSSSHIMIPASNTNSKDSPRRAALSRSTYKKRYIFPFTFALIVSTVAATFFTIALVQYTMLMNKLERISGSSYPSVVVAYPSSFHSDTAKRSKRNFHPRVVMFHDVKTREHNFGTYNSKKSSSDCLLTYSSNSSSDQIYRIPYTLGNCTPIAPWQVESKPNCNTMHEIDVPNFVISNSKKRSRLEEGSIAFLGQGWFRMAWKLHTGLATAVPKEQKHKDYYYYNGYQDYIESHYHNALSPPVILKTLRFERNFYDEYYDLHRRDAMAMERLTFSPFVLDIYGYCGQSALNEIAVDNIEAVFKRSNGHDLNTEFKLLTCLALALAVAHIHTLDKPSTLVHYDLNPRNVAIMADGTPKLNDFNVAEFLRWDNTTRQPCGFTGRFYEPWWRAPEEMKTSDRVKAEKNHLLYDPNAATLTEKVDVYSLGNVMYRILTGSAARGKSTPDRVLKVREDVVKGYLPPLDREYSSSKDQNVIAILDAMLMCYEPNPSARSTAKEVADFLASSVKSIKGSRAVKRFRRRYKRFLES